MNMTNEGASRLDQALELLGYRQEKEPHHKTNLLHAIRLHAGLIGDRELEDACNAEIERIRAEINAVRSPAKVQVNWGFNQRNAAGKLEPGTVQINIGSNQRCCMGDFHESGS